MPVNWITYPDCDAWAAGIARRVSAALAGVLATDGNAGLVVPGGGTPAPALRRLAGLPWQRLGVTLTDERWVPATHPASNAAMVVRALGPAAAHALLPLYQPGQSARAAVPACTQALAAFPFERSICLLGMGADGHVASLFPGAPQLDDGLDPYGAALCLAVDAADCVGGEPEDRMTLTFAALLRCRRILLLVSGAAKRKLLESALASGERPAGNLPVAALLAQTDVPLDIHWWPG